MKKERTLAERKKRNKRILILAGISVGSLLAVFLYKKYGNFEDLRYTLQKTAKQPVTGPAQMCRAVSVLPKPAATPVYVKPAMEPAAACAAQRICTEPFDVSRHLRNLPEGWHASAEKIATALENGFELREGQTWVNDFTKGAAA